MTTKHLTRLVLAVLLLATPLAVFAQDDGGANTEEYVSDDGRLKVMMPADWVQPAASDFPFPAVFMLNSEEAAADPNAVAMAGVKGVFVVVIPLDAFGMFGGAPVPQDATLAELADFVIGFWASPGEDASAEEVAATKIGKAEEVTLTDGVSVGSVEVASLHEDGVYFVRKLGEDLVGLVYTAAYTGEFDDAQLELGRQAAASMSYEGTADDLMAALTAPPEAQPSDEEPATLDGNTLVSERCLVCHSSYRINQANLDEAGWAHAVDQMIIYGAELTKDERQVVIDYLVSLEADTPVVAMDGAALVVDRCLVCHTRQRIDNSDKDEAGWTATVDRMIINGAELTKEERQAVIDYLVATH